MCVSLALSLSCAITALYDQSAWRAAAAAMGNVGHDFIITGQPTRSAAWGHYTSGWSYINGLGYIHTSEGVFDGNWNSLVDGE